MNFAPADSPFDVLCRESRLDLPAIAKSRASSKEVLRQIESGLADVQIDLSDDLSLVVFGSLARGEWTSGSDVDWTLLIDGPVALGAFPVGKRNLSDA